MLTGLLVSKPDKVCMWPAKIGKVNGNYRSETEMELQQYFDVFYGVFGIWYTNNPLKSA